MAASGVKWGFLVIFASFVVHLVTCGIAYSCGAIYLKFLQEFDKGPFRTAWTGSLQLALIPLAGIPATVVVYRLGIRASVILGGLLAGGGFVLASFATELWQTYTTLGVMTGAGFGFALTPSVMIVGQYYPENRDLAMGVAVSGVGIGMTFFPVLIQHLLDTYAWTRVMHILAGVSASLIVVGILMRPVPTEKTIHHEYDLLKIFEPQLLKSPVFSLLCVSNIIWSFGVSIVYTQLPSYASSGAWGSDAMILVAVTGIASLSSRLMFQLFSHSAKLDNISIFLCTIGLTAVLTGLFPELFKHKAGQIGYAIMLGLHTGFWSTFMSHVSTELIGQSYIAFGKGYLFISLGIGLGLGAPIAGLIYEEKEDFDISFYFAGACMLFSSIVMTCVNLKGCYYRPNMDSPVDITINEELANHSLLHARSMDNVDGAQNITPV